MNVWIEDTSGTMPYESKLYALEERGVRRMASQCERPSVWGSTLMMRVQSFWTGRDDGNKSEGKTSKIFTLRSVHKICLVSMLVLKICCEFARKIY
jgi:hypothetical protein